MMNDSLEVNDPHAQDGAPVSRRQQNLLGAYFLALPLVLFALALLLWPYSRPAPTSTNPNATITGSMFSEWTNTTFSMELSLIVLVMVTGGLGSYIHSATSFADFVGNRRLRASWVWWYILRAWVGVSLAMIFYFVVRGGLLSGGASASDLNPFGVAAVSGLVGMFSKQATDKLRELFDTLFKTDHPEQRADQLTNPKPEIQNISPRSGTRRGAVQLTITGTGFVRQSVVAFRGLELPTTFEGPTQLRVQLTSAMLDETGVAAITVSNPPPGGGASTEMMWKIDEIAPPASQPEVPPPNGDVAATTPTKDK
jgi:hypothetical protein